VQPFEFNCYSSSGRWPANSDAHLFWVCIANAEQMCITIPEEVPNHSQNGHKIGMFVVADNQHMVAMF